MQTSNLKTVIIFGTFDIFHKGHENFIKQARACGELFHSPPLQGGVTGCLKSVIPSGAKRSREPVPSLSREIPLARERLILAKEIPPLPLDSLRSLGVGRDDKKSFLDSLARGGIEKKLTKSYLIAVIARDKTVLKIKGALPRNNEKSRLNNLRDSGLVDKTILGSLRDKYAAIRQYKPDIICLGYDQNRFVDKLPLLYKEWPGEVIRLKPYKPHIYKSSLL